MMPEPVRILLSEAASQALLAAGECFVLAGKSSLPDPAGRVTVHLVPVEKDLAEKLSGVLLGTHRATKIKASSSSKARVVQ